MLKTDAYAVPPRPHKKRGRMFSGPFVFALDPLTKASILSSLAVAAIALATPLAFPIPLQAYRVSH